jgi:protein tyrosine/serine phosphatase
MPDEQRARLLGWEACYNARDLGGYATADGGRTRWGAFVRADNLRRLTASGRTALLSYGVRTVIDLRRAGELRVDPNPFAERAADAALPIYLNLPLGLGADSADVAAVAAAGAGEAGSLLKMSRQVLDRYWRGIASVMTAIAAAPEGAVLFHCHAGKDRTGLVAALLLAIAGVPEPTIAKDYALSGPCLQPIYGQRLSQEPDPQKRARLAQMLSAVPETMLSILEHLNTRHGGAERYLLAAGVTPADLERLRRRVRE